MDKYEKRRISLIELRDKRCGGSNATLARTIGRDPSYVTRMTYPEGKPGRKRIGEDIVEAIESSFALPKGWMDRVDIEEKQQFSNVEIAVEGSRKVPLISFVQAGAMTEVVDPYAVGAAERWINTDLDLSSNAFALKIKGNSMLPEFNEGDVIIVDPSIAPSPGDYVVAKNTEEEATFKKYRPRGMNERGDFVFELIPLNEDYAPLRSDISHIKIIGVMVEHRRYRKK